MVIRVCLPDDPFGSPAKEVAVNTIKSAANTGNDLNMVDSFP